MQTLAEKKEIVFDRYKNTYDLEIALDTAIDLTDEERKAIKSDPIFNARCRIAFANEQETIIGSIRNLGFSADKDNVRLSALIKYGEIVAPNKFKKTVSVEITDYVAIGRKKTVNAIMDEDETGKVAIIENE